MQRYENFFEKQFPCHEILFPCHENIKPRHGILFPCHENNFSIADKTFLSTC
jgi:hypothetical protein